MSDILDYRIFVRAVAVGNLSSVGREMDLSTAAISKRLTGLEERLGVRLLNRTTRQITATEAGRAFHGDIVSVLAALEEAESAVTGNARQAMGVLRVSAPTVFARLHITPRLGPLLDEHPGLRLALDLNDGFSDVGGGNIDVGIRIMVPENSSLIARKLAPNRRFFVASPDYLAEHGTPRTLEDLGAHRVLNASSQVRWRIEGPEGALTLRPASVIETNSSDAVRGMVIAGLGISLRSTWDIGDELRNGTLLRVLPEYRGASEVGLYAVYASRRFVPLKVRLFVDYLASIYGSPPHWDRDLPD
jgi:DNA-binding transcriptional LysR family regulator